MSKRIPYIGAFLMLAVICSVLLTGCSKSLQSQSASRTELVMSTVVTITLYGEQAQEGVNAAFQKAKDLEKILSSQNEKSELHQVNQSAYDHEVEVSDALFTVAQRSCNTVKRQTVLGCTIGKINDLWAFGTGNAKLPDEEEITPLLMDKGMNKLQLDEEKRTIRF
ncbi:MAG: FAD:protein FMN transferase [Acutalibacteraceae bacterium]